MGSAEIRGLIEDEKEDPGFSISGPNGLRAVGIRDQVRRIVDGVDKLLDLDRARDLSSKDIYTRKARFSQNIHYLDKKTDKTLFVDTGKAISLRRTGITESGVAIALKLAQDRFGSTLTITGSAEFKTLVVEAAAKNGMDVHFTDKAMNESLAARRAELEIERDGQDIEPGQSIAKPETTEEVQEGLEASKQGPTPLNFVHNNQPVTLDLSRYSGQPAAADLAQNNNAFLQREAAWRQSMQLPGREVMTEEQVRASDSVMAVRGEDHALWLVNTHDKSPEAVAMISAYLENDSYRDSFKRVIEDFYAVAQGSPEALQSLDVATDFVEPLVREIERKKYEAAPADADEGKPDSANPAKPASDRKLIQGELIDHGEAPYRNMPDKEPSYFVTVKTDAGDRTLWGVGLASPMAESGAYPGDRVRIEDLGTEPVIVQETQPDGSVINKSSYRREWEVERETTEQDVPRASGAEPATEHAAGSLVFTYEGQPASLGLRPVEPQEKSAAATAPLASPEPDEDHGPDMG